MDLSGRKRDLVRREIVESAYALFGEHGYDATTVEMIAAQVGVSGRTVYRYFDSKESIAFGALTGYVDDCAEVVRRHCSDDVSMSGLVAAFAEHLGRHADQPAFAALTALMRDNPALIAPADRWRQGLAQRIAAEIADLEGVSEPRLVDDARAAAVVWVCGAAISTWVQGGQTQDLAQLAREAGAVLTGDA